MRLSVVSARARIADMVTTAIANTRARRRGTTWVKTISTPASALRVTITYPSGTVFQRAIAGAPKWEVRYTSSTFNWSVYPAPMGGRVEGAITHQLDADFWDDLTAILPRR